MKTYVIAEGGACHDGQAEKFDGLIKEAAKAGADAIKFQWTSDPFKMAARRGKATSDGYGNIYMKYLGWAPEAHEYLHGLCKSQGIDYMCTVYLPEDIDVVAPYVSMFKIASFESLDDEFIEQHLEHEQTTLVSIGMASKLELQRGLAWNSDAVLMQCTSSYPTPVEDLNLNVIDGVHITGFSDHSEPAYTWTGALGIAHGATVVEAHLRLNSTSEANPDRNHAMNPLQFTEYVRHIRFAETAAGSDTPQCADIEQPMRRYRVAASE